MHALLAQARCVIFDMDGTLVHSPIDFPRLNEAARALAASVGFPLSSLVAHDALGIVYEVCEGLGEAAAAFRLRAFRAFEEIEAEAGKLAVPRHGALELVTALAEGGVPVGVMTRNGGRLASELLRDFPLGALVSRNDVRRVKPDPEHIRAVLARLDCAEEGIVVVGDHPLDILAGRVFSTATVGVLTPGKDAGPLQDAAPDLLVEELADLL